jgi:hypothetical protein
MDPSGSAAASSIQDFTLTLPVEEIGGSIQRTIND